MKPLSLLQKLWLLLTMMVALALSGALVINLNAHRNYLEQQLSLRNADTAQSLAMLISQRQSDPVWASRLIDTAFAQGQFARISWQRVLGPGQVERLQADGGAISPRWFRRLLPIEPAPGQAQVLRGWQQDGQVLVVSAPDAAYNTLWLGALDTVAWVAAVTLLAGLLGYLDIRRVRRQLDCLVEQAQAVSEQRFQTMPLPSLPEFATVTAAMNRMVERLQLHLRQQGEEMSRLRHDVEQDPVSGLYNRSAFEQRLEALLSQPDDPGSGYLFLLRLSQLAELNRQQGAVLTDTLIKTLSSDLALRAQAWSGACACRLRGADFALLCPEMGEIDAAMLADELNANWERYRQQKLSNQPVAGHLGLTPYRSGDAPAQVLLRAAQALEDSQRQEHGWRCWSDDGQGASPFAEPDWSQLLKRACRDESLRLTWYPVRNAPGRLLWHEGMLWLPGEEGEEAIQARRLLAHGARLGLTAMLDLAALKRALRPGAPRGRLALNFSPASLADDFTAAVCQLLADHNEHSFHFEFQQAGLAEHWQAFRDFCRQVQPLGHKVAVEILEADSHLLTRLSEAGIGYLVLDHTLTHKLHQSKSRQELLRSLLLMAGVMGLELQAKGLTLQQDCDTLIEMGIHTLTGPVVR